MTVVTLFTRQLKTFSRYIQIRFITQNTQDLKWRRIKDFRKNMPESRKEPIITKLNTPEFKSIFSPELNSLTSLFNKYNYEIRIAGGAVRDLLMEKIPKDIDFATTATPDEMKNMFTIENIRMLNLKGEKHGTITARINDKENFEITTLRIDVVTDGRHADIEFTKDWILDANRRDLTINSMFLDFDGNVYDYFYGYDDLMKKRIAFVGDAATRICEDFLRILRYFRFYGRIAEHADNHEPATINAIKENVAGLERISGERIWMEWSKILSGNFGIELTQKMIDCGVAKYIGLPDTPNMDNFKKICLRARERGIKLHPVTMVTAMLNNAEDVMKLHTRLHWSAYNRELALFLMIHKGEKISVKPLYPYQYILLNTSSKVKDVREYIIETLNYEGKEELAEEFSEWIAPRFPINGTDLKDIVPHPRMISKINMKLKKIWLDSDFTMEKNELIKYVPELIEDLREEIEEYERRRSERQKK